MIVIMKNKIKEYIYSKGIKECGVTRFNGKCAIVCLFPYFDGYHGGNLSVYAYSKDYHMVIREILSDVCRYIEELSSKCKCEVFADIGPEVDRKLAYNAGLGFYGRNGMLINDRFGSFFFIGYILCDLELEDDVPLNKTCLNCGKCVRNCPGGALDKGFDIDKCASHISQKKGELTIQEEEILKKSGLIFGCDMCQKVCPHNSCAGGAMAEFLTDRIFSVKIEDLENLSNRQFNEKYGDRAFAWRGKGVLIRNLRLLET